MITRLLRAYRLLAVPAAALAFATPSLHGVQAAGSEAATIHGSVVDAGNGRPLANVDVRIIPAGPQTTTDAAGRFQLRLAPARYILETRLIGYASRQDTVSVAAGQVIDMRVILAVRPVELPALAVEVRSPDLRRVGFYDRRDEEPGGYFVTAGDVERRSPQFTSDMLRNIPSVRVQYFGAGRRDVVFVRGSACTPDFFLDGTRIMQDSDIDRISPSEVAGIEVYIGGMTPIQYKVSSCGAILVWTKRGGR